MNKTITKQRMSHKCKNRQMGLSLVELMISMVIGLFLLAGVVTNFIGTSHSDKVRSAMSEMDANARAGMNILRQTIMHAGYPSIHSKVLDKAFYSTKDGAITNPICRDSVSRDISTPSLTNHATKDADNGDVLTVISLADNPCLPGNTSCDTAATINPEALIYYDCMSGGTARDAHAVSCSADPLAGMVPPSSPNDAKIYSSFVLTDNTLSCAGSRSTGSEVLVDNVEAIQYLYGVKYDNGNIVYRTATEIESSDQWEAIVSVQVGLLMRSAKDIMSADNPVMSYFLLDKEVTIDATDKRRVFNIYTSTIFLANKDRGVFNAN